MRRLRLGDLRKLLQDRCRGSVLPDDDAGREYRPTSRRWKTRSVSWRQIAERRGWEVVEEYRDAGISGAKGRDGRPGLDQLLKDASKRRFDVVMAWAID